MKVLLRMILRPVKFCSRQEIRLADIAPSNSLLGAIGVYRWLYGGYVEYWAQCIPMAPSKLHSTLENSPEILPARMLLNNSLEPGIFF